MLMRRFCKYYPVTYLCADTDKCDNVEEKNSYPSEFLRSPTPSGMPPHSISLKEGCIIVLIHNLSLRQDICNGSELEVTLLHNNCVQAKRLCGANVGNHVLIPRIKLTPSDAHLPFTMKRTQFPLRLAYSMTINKSLRPTFEKVGIYLLKPLFTHGQFYVTLALADMKVTVLDTEKQGKEDT